jgi:hypothetical protein
MERTLIMQKKAKSAKSQSPEITGFNYSLLPDRVAETVRKATVAIKLNIASTAIKTGDLLITVKEQLDHGQFSAWLRAELHLTPRTAERCIRAALLAAKNDIVSGLKATALYALAAPSTPESVQAAVIAKLENGDHVRSKDIYRLLQKTQLAGDKGGKSRSNRGDQEKRLAAKQKPSAKAIRGEDIRDFSADPKHVQMVQMKPEVGKQVLKRLPPANKEFFLGPHSAQGRLV